MVGGVFSVTVGGLGRPSDIVGGVRLELVQAMVGAKVVGLTTVLHVQRTVFRDTHAAYGICRHVLAPNRCFILHAQRAFSPPGTERRGIRSIPGATVATPAARPSCNRGRKAAK